MLFLYFQFGKFVFQFCLFITIVYHCWAIILIAYACIVAFARIPYFERGLSIGGNIRFDIPVAHLYAAVFLFLGRSLYGVCISAFSVRMHNCGKAIDFLLAGCGGEMPVVGVWLEMSVLVCTQPINGGYKEPVGCVRFQCSGREEVCIGYTVLACGLYVYVFLSFVYIHRVGDCMQQVAPSYGLVSFQFIVDERVAAFAQRYDVAAEYFQSGIVPAIFGGVFQITLFAAQQPKRGDYFAVSIGCVACNVTYPVADIVAWNPSVAFRTYALPHAV